MDLRLRRGTSLSAIVATDGVRRAGIGARYIYGISESIIARVVWRARIIAGCYIVGAFRSTYCCTLPVHPPSGLPTDSRHRPHP